MCCFGTEICYFSVMQWSYLRLPKAKSVMQELLGFFVVWMQQIWSWCSVHNGGQQAYDEKKIVFFVSVDYLKGCPEIVRRNESRARVNRK